MQMTIGTVLLVCLASASVAGETASRQITRQLIVPVGQVREADVDYKIGFACDDLSILRAWMQTRDGRNWFVVEGLAAGSTLCRVGNEAVPPTYLFEVVVEP
jgi:hypothetical protein